MRWELGNFGRFFGMILSLAITSSAMADPVCSNLLIETKAGEVLMKRFRTELKKAIFPELRRLNWKGRKFISVQNLPEAGSRIAPKYMIRIDLKNLAQDGSKVVLRNKQVQSPLKLTSHPRPEEQACDLVLESMDNEYLVNQVDVPTKIFVPSIKVTTRVKFVSSRK